jgi:hypothetical protein
MTNNAEVVANALKMDDTPNVGEPQLDPENAQLLQLFEDTASSDEPPGEGETPPEPSTEGGEGDKPPELAAPAEPPPAEPTPPAEPVLDPSQAAELPPAEPPAAAPPEPSAEDRIEWRKGAIEKVQEHYKGQLDNDEMRDLLLTEPEKALPQILANAYMDMYDSLMGGVTQSMPAHVQNIIRQQKESAANEAAFFDEYPALKEAYAESEEKQGIINRAVQTYRQMNPQATSQQAIKEAGAMAMVALRIPVPGAEASPPRPTDKGFAPAAPGGGTQGGTPPAPKELNEFEKLAQEFVDDEEV